MNAIAMGICMRVLFHTNAIAVGICMRVLFHTNAIAVGICISLDEIISKCIPATEKYKVDHLNIVRANIALLR